MRSLVISSGHGKYVSGAVGILNEVTEARRVVDRVYTLLSNAGVTIKKFHDDTSKDQNTNLNTIVNFHNKQSRDLDVSVHFNSYQNTSKPMGVEVLYLTQSSLAAALSADMADAEGLPNRGGKKRTDLFFLNNTDEPAILIETCFVDSSADANAYNSNFEAVCKVIAEGIANIVLDDLTEPPIEPPTEPPPTEEDRPTLKLGSSGPYVLEVQETLYCSPYDSDFGDLTDRAVKGFQRGVGLPPNGIVDAATWEELDKLEVVEDEGILSQEEINDIIEMADQSAIAGYSWRDRGQAPDGFTAGMAVAYGQAVKLLGWGLLPFQDMAKANTHDPDKDVLEWYRGEFDALGMSNETAGINTLRHVYAFMIGMGMRESSGRHCEGRDMSADNVTSDTAEAGLFQTSWNAKSCSPNMQSLFDKYESDVSLGHLDVFKEGVSCSSDDWNNYGSGDGNKFQWMCKNQPTFAVETAAIVIRNLRQHYGPINRKEVELKKAADDMLKEVERILDAAKVA